MVLVAKVFELKEPIELTLAARKLRSFREEEPHGSGQETKKLTTEIIESKLEGDSFSAIFSKDFVISRYYKRGLVETVVTEEVPFWIKRYKDRLFLIVLAPSKARGVKKLLTNYVANKISDILFIRTGAIVETKISHETLKELHESNPHATKLIWFDNVDIPGVGKLALAGSGLADTKLYREYLEHGKLWYVVWEVAKRGLVVGITRNTVVTLFSRSTVKEFVDFIMTEILPIVE
jgi:hypothetical protein